MKFELVKDDDLSGNECSVYQVFLEDDQYSLYDAFYNGHVGEFEKEVKNIDDRLYFMGHDTGARENFFKKKEGSPGDLVCALYDEPNSNLRLYCIRYGMDLIVLGGGGHKPKNIRAYQEKEDLNTNAEIIKNISKAIYRRQRDGELKFSASGKDFEGELFFEEE